MSDKVLEQVAAVLSGKRVKFLDPTRKAVLALPNAAFKVWMAYWMHESDGQEAYPEMDTLVRVTGMGENTIRRARKYLLDTGWLIQLDGSAGSRYARATNGAWNIMVFRVNDPTSKLEPSTQEMTGQNLTVPKNTPSFLEPNVASAFAVASTGTTTVSSPATDTLATPHTPCVRESLAPPITSLREKKPAPSETRHENQQPVKTPPITAPPPTLFNCPACDLTQRKGYQVAEHIETEHPELGQQSFEISCTVDGCYWSTWWNKVQDNKAARDADLLNHLEVQHNPGSPRYDPWETCSECSTVLPRRKMLTHQCSKSKAA